MPLDPQTCPDAGPTSSLGCPGTCAPEAPGDWKGPVLVTNTDPNDGTKVLCPDGTTEVFRLWTAPQFEPPTCPECTCATSGPPQCIVPTKWSAHADICQNGPNPVSYSYDAAPGWNGACTAANSLPAGALCDGVPCVRSLTVEAPVAVNAPCVTFQDGEPVPADEWTINIQSTSKGIPPYATVQRLGCADDGAPCTSGACSKDPEPGHSVCVYQEGELDCPEEWPERELHYGEVADTRACTECSCTQSPASCEVQIHLYAKTNCTDEMLSAYIPSTTSPASCHDLAVGAALGSKKVEVTAAESGECTPHGGELTGELTLGKPTTLCCLA